jgi:hypothetical protein
MPEACTETLAATDGMFDRFLPRLRQRIAWSERKWTVILVGMGDEQILDSSACPATPLVTPIERGRCVVGFELHRALGLQPDESISILGAEFTIERCEGELGTKEDITIWLNLEDCQQLTGQMGRINEVMVVEHLSVWGRSAEIQERIAELLPDVQLVELASETMSRAHARIEVADQAEAAVEREQQRLELLRAERTGIIRAFLPLGILACAVWVGMTMYLNVRDRRPEIGVLMAQGFRGMTVRRLIFSKAIFQGIAGGTIGFLLGAGAAIAWETAGPLTGALATGVGLAYLGLAISISTATCLLASWLPASLAVRTDPAVVLRQQ